MNRWWFLGWQPPVKRIVSERRSFRREATIIERSAARRGPAAPKVRLSAKHEEPRQPRLDQS
jgi:hypothetical protein